MRREQESVCRLFRGSISLLAVAVIGILASSRPLRADYQFCGTLDSAEWLVDSSQRIIIVAVEPIERNDGTPSYRLSIVSILKQPKDGTLKVGDVVPATGMNGEPPTKKGRLLWFLPERAGWKLTQELELTDYNPPEDPNETGDYLVPDKSCRPIRKAQELLDLITKRVASGRQATPDHSPKVSDLGFEISAMGDLDNSEGYFNLRVPPDPDLRPLLENGTLMKGVEAQATLYRYYSGRTDAQRAADRQQDILTNLAEVKSLIAKKQIYLEYQSAVTFPRYRDCKASPDGKYAAILDGDELLLYATADNALLYEAKDCYHDDWRLNGLIFSPDGKYFAHLLENGDAAVFNLAEKKPQSVGQLGWAAGKRFFLAQFTFSPDSQYLALNLHARSAGEGSAVLVWKVETGECLYTKSKNWELEKDLQIVGFDPYSGSIQVTESEYFDLVKKRPLPWVVSGWHLANDNGQPQGNNMPYVINAKQPGK